jgi:hypothetical protein
MVLSLVPLDFRDLLQMTATQVVAEARRAYERRWVRVSD